MHDQVLHDRHFHGHVSRTRQQRIIAEFAWADTKYKAVAFRALHSRRYSPTSLSTQVYSIARRWLA